jgi:hypothetical protein
MLRKFGSSLEAQSLYVQICGSDEQDRVSSPCHMTWRLRDVEAATFPGQSFFTEFIHLIWIRSSDVMSCSLLPNLTTLPLCFSLFVYISVPQIRFIKREENMNVHTYTHTHTRASTQHPWIHLCSLSTADSECAIYPPLHQSSFISLIFGPFL